MAPEAYPQGPPYDVTVKAFIDGSTCGVVSLPVVVVGPDLDVDSDNSGSQSGGVDRSGAEDAVEMDSPGKWIYANDDDSNGDGFADNADNYINGPPDSVDVAALVPGYFNPAGYADPSFILAVDVAGVVRVFEERRAGAAGLVGAAGLPLEVELPEFWGWETMGVEGLSAGEAVISLIFKDGETEICRDEALVTVVDMDLVYWVETPESPLDYNEYPDPEAALGKRIFPGKTSPTDTTARDKVMVRASVEPPIAGVPVYFRAFDIDDPSANEAPVDDESQAQDNRGTPKTGSPERYNSVTDAEGEVEYEFTVTKQPGDNFKVVGHLKESWLEGLTVEQDSPRGVILDSVGEEVSIFRRTGLVTVWRRLHVEVDSMGAPDVGANSMSGTVQGVPTQQPNGRWIVDVADLDPDFHEPAQHYVGRIDIQGFGTFVTTDTIISWGDDEVEVINAPAAIAGAEGAPYMLWDDDAGSADGFVMAGFDAPPVTLPKVPDAGLMAGVFAEAYVDVPPPDMQYYDSNGAFDRNVRNNSEAVSRGSHNRDLTSVGAYWVVHVTSGFQGYVNKDGDPDSEQGIAGLQYGITGARLSGVPRAGSLVYVETIRDDKRGNTANMETMERYTIAHEVGHQCMLEHTDGRSPPDDDEDPADDFIMTDILDQTGMASNVAFSPVSLNKLRSMDYPPQE